MKCSDCKYYATIRRWTYTDKGVKHESPEGFVCTAMHGLDGIVIHMVGSEGVCEMFEKEGGNNVV